MKLLDRHVVRDLFLPFMSGTVTIAILFMLNELIAILKYQVNRIPPVAIVQLALLAMPKWVQLCIPLGMSFAVALVVSRLVRENEMTALRTSGVRISRVLAPIIATGIFLSFLSFYLSGIVVPLANTRHELLGQQFLTVTGRGNMFEDQPFRFGRYDGRAQHIERQKDGSLLLSGIFLHEQVGIQGHVIYVAQTGSYRNEIWTLNQAYVYNVDGLDLVSLKAEDTTVQQKIILPTTDPSAVNTENIFSMAKQISEMKKLHEDTRSTEAEFYSMFVIPATCLLFTIMSAYSAVRFAMLGPFVGVFVGTLWAVLYFNLHVIATQIVVANGWLPPLVSVFSPFVIMSVIAFFLTRKVE